MKIKLVAQEISQYLFKEKKNTIFFILFVLSLNSVSLSKNYSLLIEIYEKNQIFETKNNKIINSIYEKKQSEKWFLKYLEYKNEKKENNIELSEKLAYQIYRFSYIKDDDIILDSLKHLFKTDKISDAISLFENEKQHYSKDLFEILKKFKSEIIAFSDIEKYYSLIYSIGFYDYLLENNVDDIDTIIKCHYGKRDYNNIINSYENTKENLSDDTLFFISKAYAIKDNYNKSINILDNIKNKSLLYNYYYYFYSIVSGKKIEFQEIIDNVKNSYYSGKLIYELLKRNLITYNNIDKELINDKFIFTKIIAGIDSDYTQKEKDILYNSFFSESSKSLYKQKRKLNNKKNFFTPDNNTLTKLFEINPTIIYNDIMLTTSLVGKELSLAYFKNYLPEHGLKSSYKLYNKELYFLRYPLGYINEVIKASEKYKVDPLLVFSIIREESAYKWDVSERGASGLMQIMPATGKWIEEKFDIKKDQTRIAINIEKGTAYLSYLIDKYKDYSIPYIYAILAYNGGPGNVDKWLLKHGDSKEFLLNIPFFETERYLFKVYDTYINYIKYYNDSK
ncbi:MAG: lytic transglycosylase domain-containing protein [Candidatus Muirbacterium halophilum]|nr:lytic transglycosylase domain-containing protein [Candidatus Muirbacterium halophilum]MCK9475164.1 lytic transglycosylase domain-containing protein [Candidatus Muirbacterium halophilum]